MKILLKSIVFGTFCGLAAYMVGTGTVVLLGITIAWISLFGRC